MYSPSDSLREFDLATEAPDESRSEWRIDFARLIHSPSFRRLQGKTQLYPGLESDFFRNRLTHSLEVAQIAKSIANFLNHKYKSSEHKICINPEICEFAGLAHDLGHPPFGHQGEQALDECMSDYGGFEGNAQTLKILSRIEKKIKNPEIVKGIEYRYGLNLTYRSLASILKYDKVIPILQNDRDEDDKNHAVKGYYYSESDLVKKIKDHVVGEDYAGKFKTIECQIMDIADDIAYSTYDLEDGLKAEFYHPIDLLNLSPSLYEDVAKKVAKAINKDKPESDKINFGGEKIKQVIYEIFGSLFTVDKLDFEGTVQDDPDSITVSKDGLNELSIELSIIFNKASKELAKNGNIRTNFTSGLIDQAINAVELVSFNEEFPCMSKVAIREDIKIKVEVLKNLTYEFQILSPRLKVAEYRGKEIVKGVFKSLIADEGWRLMPEDYQSLYHHFEDIPSRCRVVCDYIAGMTDRYCIEFSGRLHSENPETIFKPI